MHALSEKMGHFCAHAVWSVSDGGVLIPMLVTERADGWQMSRLVFADMADGVRAGREVLDHNPDGNRRAILIYDAYLRLGEVEYDAVFADGRVYRGGDDARAGWAVPYRPASAGFAVHRPKILRHDGTDDGYAFAAAFWRGVDTHAEGAALWNAFIDESV